jgi:hypothetical protein
MRYLNRVSCARAILIIISVLGGGNSTMEIRVENRVPEPVPENSHGFPSQF